MSPSPPGDDGRFRALYAAQFDDLLAYALRRVALPEDAADVVAETFLVAWRRRDTLPPADEARLWLYGVARKTLANQRRSGHRRERLGDRLRSRLAHQVAPDHSEAIADLITVRTALARLGELDREVLTLTAWEGLEPREIAEMLGLAPSAVRKRLSRARERLQVLIGADLSGHALRPFGHVPDIRTIAPEEDS